MKLLFVCTGNICRSPTADGLLRHAIQTNALQGWYSDSAGTQAYHVGEAPDPRTIRTAAGHGVDLSTLRARQVTRNDFYDFDALLAMDAGHLAQLRRMAPADATATVALFLEYAGMGSVDVADPYYGPQQGFDTVFSQCQTAIARIVAGSSSRA